MITNANDSRLALIQNQMKSRLPAQQVPKSTDHEKLKAVSKDFESIFVNQMLSTMRESVTKGDFIPESSGERIFRGMLDQEYSKQMADRGEFGLARSIYDQLKNSLPPANSAQEISAIADKSDKPE